MPFPSSLIVRSWSRSTDLSVALLSLGITMSKEPKPDYNKREIKERFDAMLKGAMKSPPKPMKEIQTATAKRRALKAKKKPA